MLFRFLTLVHVCAAFPFKCPEPAQWSTRARGHCLDPSKYFCLKNDLINGYSENCTVFDFLPPGRKHVLRGGLDADICSSERYQPWPITFYTNVSTNCIFLKSACNEEGLVVYNNGNRSTDITCRCDYTRGYDFIIKPRNQYFCVPSEEDCSCYLKMCQDSGYVLSPDYGCIHSKKNISINQCKPIIDSRIHKESNQSDTEDKKQNRQILNAEKFITTAAILVTSMSLVVVFLSYPFARVFTNCYIKHNYFSKALFIDPAKPIEGNNVSISCEINQIDVVGIWYKNGSPVSSADRIECDINEKLHTLKIKKAELSDSAVYSIDFQGTNRQTQLHVEDYFSKALSIDPKGPIEGNDISISCEIKQKNVSGMWYKNESILATTEKMKYDVNGRKHKLTITKADLSDSAVYCIDFGGVKRQIKLEVNVLPEAINQLSEEDKIRFYKLMQTSKTENRYFVKVMIVGKEGAGKTCLLRRLMKENINDVSSTDGINIVIHRCKINVENGKWTFGKEIHDDIVDRIKRALVTNDKDSDTKNMQVHGTKNRNGDVTSAYKNDLPTEKLVNLNKNEYKNETSSLVMADYFTNDASLNHQNTDWNESSSLVMPADLLSHVFSRSTVNTQSNQYALCDLWDFAGQKDFYATHQAFLTSNAVYLVVADMKDDIIKQDLIHCFEDYQYIGEYVDFWFDSIHCHRTVSERASKGHFDPPILLVFTGKDKYNKVQFKKREKELNDQIEHAFRYKSKHSHLHERFFLSNKEDVDEEFEKLRYAVFENAEKMDIWGKSFPLKWILLEHLIEINKNHGINFITFTDMLNLAKHSDINIIKEDDLLLFLRFQHNVGNIIFFENIRDLIILNPQWLADAFRCLVSDRIDIRRLHHLQDWKLFTQQGKISESLITELFESKYGSQFAGQKVNLNAVMEKLDILVKIQDSSYYIMPSMMKSSTFDDVCQTFGILSKNCYRSSWLCLKFVFLPPSFFNYLSASFLRKYYPSQVNNGTCLYRGICMFDIDSSGCEKILVTMSTDTIALQVVSFSEQQEGFGSTCSDIYSQVKQFIGEMIKRYMMKISYKLHFKCSDGYYHKDTFAFENLTRDQECFCAQHKQNHLSEKLYSLWMKNEVKRSLHDRMQTSTKKVDLNPSGEATAGQ